MKTSEQETARAEATRQIAGISSIIKAFSVIVLIVAIISLIFFEAQKHESKTKTREESSLQGTGPIYVACPSSGERNLEIHASSDSWKSVRIPPRCDFKIWVYDESENERLLVKISPGEKVYPHGEFLKVGHVTGVREIGFRSHGSPVILTLSFYPFGTLPR